MHFREYLIREIMKIPKSRNFSTAKISRRTVFVDEEKTRSFTELVFVTPSSEYFYSVREQPMHACMQKYSQQLRPSEILGRSQQRYYRPKKMSSL